MKTVAIISSCDTKYQEAIFMRDLLRRYGQEAMVVDMSIGPGESKGADISRETVLSNIGVDWKEARTKTKGELVKIMTDAMKTTVLRLYQDGKIDGVMAAGGVQNTTVATSAMQLLPIGFPKLIATTVACGQKQFGDVVGLRDIVVIPSISDFTGLNMMTRKILSNACACMAGMMQHAGSTLVKESGKPVVGVSLMGITNEGCCAAINELTRRGAEAIGFHTTGVGGSIMEQLALNGTIDAILDMTTHEITSEYFGGGFSYGAKNRLTATLEKWIPMVVSVGGLDFVDFRKDAFPPRMNERVYNMHNAQLAHIKILPDEAVEVGKIFAERLNRSSIPVTLVLPTEGMRKDTRKGGNLYCKETDDALLGTILKNIGPNVRVQVLEGNLNDVEWGRKIAGIMAEELVKKGFHLELEVER